MCDVRVSYFAGNVVIVLAWWGHPMAVRLKL